MIIVDFTESANIAKSNAFHGGGNYAKRMIRLLATNGKQITVLIPSDFKVSTGIDHWVFDNDNIKFKKINSMEDLRGYSSSDVLFIPLLSVRRFKIVEKIKQQNPGIRIYVTVHGVRTMDLKPDFLDTYYNSNSKNKFEYAIAKEKYAVEMKVYKSIFRKYLTQYDCVFTVSNDSMQKIQSLCTPKKIKYFYQGNINYDYSTEVLNEKKTVFDFPVTYDWTNENYALFVSGGRAEKNFLRTMIAFLNFKHDDKTNLQLFVTGVSEEKKANWLKCPDVDQNYIKSVHFLPYVSSEQLDDLYKNCRFLLYPSKSEGFGLPLMEACLKNKPVLASSITAMPEVLESAIDYVNPYSVESISEGIREMSNADMGLWSERLEERKNVVLLRIENGDKDVLNEFD